MKKLSLIFLLFAVVFSAYSQDAEPNSNQVKRYHYRDSIISMEKWYGDDKKLDSLKTYHDIGSINEIFYYKKGSLHGFGFSFNKEGKKITTWKFKKGRTIQRINHTLDINYVYKEKAQYLFNELNAVNNILRHDSEDFIALTKRANLRLMLYNRTLALNDFIELENQFKYLKKSGLEMSPKFFSSFYGSIGSLYNMNEDDNKALDYKYKSLSLRSKDKENLVNYMVANYNFGAYLNSIKAYRLSFHYLNIVLKKWKKHGFTNRTLANLHTDLGQYRTALSHAEIAFPKEDTIIKYSSRKPVKDLRTIRGWLYHKTGKTNKGIIDLKEALEINEENAFAHRHLGVIYHDIGNYELACKHLQKAKDLYYEEVYDRYDLDSFLKSSCSNKPFINTKEVSIYENLIKEPYIFPNPITDHCIVKNFQHDIYDYEIYDMSSKLITQNRTTKNRINISSLPQGVYNLSIIKDNLIKTFLIIKE